MTIAIEWEEIIEPFTFREKGQIKIPKQVREVAFSLAIDLEIVSQLKEQYLDFSSYPANGYYGKVILVNRDFSERHIDITQSRQRLYYYINDHAIANWDSCVRTDWLLKAHKTTQELVCALYPLIVSSCAVQPCPEFEIPTWIESELREVYVKCFYGTQFKIEVSYRKFSPFTDLCGRLLDGKSGQQDGDKDDGLPPNSAPQNAGDPNKPYNRLPPPSSPLELGDYLNAKQGLDEPNPDNSPDLKYWIKFVVPMKDPNFVPPCSQKISTIYFEIPFPNIPYTIQFTSKGSSCDGYSIGLYQIKRADNGALLGQSEYHGSSGGSATYGQGFQVPANELYK